MRLLAAAQSAPAKSDLQQFSVVVMRDRATHQADCRLDRHDGLDRHGAGLPGVVRRHAARPAAVRNARHAARQQQPGHVPEHRSRLHAGHGGNSWRRPTRWDWAPAPSAMSAAISNAYPRCSACPSGVYPVAGLSVGWPVFRRPVSMRLPPSIVVHRERYDDSALEIRTRRLRCSAAERSRPGRGRQPEEQRCLPAARRRRLERECGAAAFGARAVRLRRLSENEGFRSCLMTPRSIARPPTDSPRQACRQPDRAGGSRHDEPHMLMGMRGAKHRFMPNRLVFPGGRVDRADLTMPISPRRCRRHRAASAQKDQRKTRHAPGRRRRSRTA